MGYTTIKTSFNNIYFMTDGYESDDGTKLKNEFNENFDKLITLLSTMALALKLSEIDQSDYNEMNEFIKGLPEEILTLSDKINRIFYKINSVSSGEKYGLIFSYFSYDDDIAFKNDITNSFLRYFKNYYKFQLSLFAC